MKLQGYKLIFAVLGLIGVLLITSPAIEASLRLPAGEQFSELYLLGPGQTATDYPHDVIVGQNYTVYAGVTNHLGSSAYYALYVKLMNQTDAYPNSASGVASPVTVLYENRFVLQNNQNWVGPVSFSVSAASFAGNQCIVQTLVLNNMVLNVNKPAVWDANSSQFSYTLLFELWLYNPQTGHVEFNNRYVSLQINIA